MKENLASLSNQPTTSRRMDQDSLTREYIDSLRSEITELRRQLQTACTEKNQLLQLFLGQASSLQASLNPVTNQSSANPPVQRTKTPERADDLQGNLPTPATARTIASLVSPACYARGLCGKRCACAKVSSKVSASISGGDIFLRAAVYHEQQEM